MNLQRFFIFSLLLIYCSVACGQLKLPLTFVTGYGPFQVDKSYIKFDSPPEDNPLYKSIASLQYNKIPASLQSPKKGIVWFDFSQFLYQNVHSGNLSKEFYEQYCKQNFITTPEAELSKLPISCYVLVVKGINIQGKEVLLIDTDNDKDFSDESPNIIPEYTSDEDFQRLVNKAIQIDYQAILNKKLITRKLPFIALSEKDKLFYSIPQYAVAKLKVNNVTHTIAVSHGFRFPNFSVANITLVTNQKASTDSIARINQLLHVDQYLYKNAGVGYASMSLQLEEVKGSVSSTQKGMPAISFKGVDVVSRKELSLADFKGKYLFIDFWGTWCSPCVAQLPDLKRIYSTIDKSKIAFLGIAGKDDIDKLRKLIGEKNILWSNILSDETNKIVEKYTIVSYPTGILLDPDGKIIETDVPAVNLTTILRKYL